MRRPAIGVDALLAPGVYARAPASELPYPLGLQRSAVFSRARHALWQGVQALGLEPGDAVLVPAYHHGSEIEALLRAGLEPRFYGATPSLAPDGAELEALLDDRTRALYLTHYLGFPQAVARWRMWCDERGLLLLEDAGQAWLAADASGPVGSLGDLAIYCLYKMVPVPDGGALMIRTRAPGPETRVRLGLRQVAKRHAQWAANRSRAMAALADKAAGDGRYDPLADFALGDPASAPAAATLALVPRLADAHVAARRRANYAALLGELGADTPAPFDALPDGACPLAFPVESADKERLLARFREHGIVALDVWSVAHPLLEDNGSSSAASRRARTVALPVHQDLRPADLSRIAAAARGPRPRAPQLRFEALESFDAVAAEWDELALRSANVFATREWMSLWWRHLGGGKRLLLTACRSRDELVAILPVYLTISRGVRLLRFVGHGTADQLGPVCAPETRVVAARALRRFLDECPDAWDFFVGELLPGELAWSSLLGGRTLGRDGYPILRFAHGTWDEYMASRGRHFRKQTAQSERRLRDEHHVRFRLADDPARLDNDLDVLFRLHRMRWTDEESPFGANEAFHRDLAKTAFHRDWLRLWFMEIDGEPIAAEQTFRFAGRQNHYQGGRHPDWDRASAGSLLLTHAVRSALEDGLSECRFLRGREGYKYRFANSDPGLETIVAARGRARGAALATTSALRRRPEVQRLRHWLEK